jgi:hypothetical protein
MGDRVKLKDRDYCFPTRWIELIIAFFNSHAHAMQEYCHKSNVFFKTETAPENHFSPI